MVIDPVLSDRINKYLSTLQVDDEIRNGTRYYKIHNNKEYPSVTSILSSTSNKQFLEAWRQSIGEEKADQIVKDACTRGGSLHDLIERHYIGQIDPNVDKSSPGWKLFKKLQIYLKDLKPIAIELPLWSDSLKLAGRVDFVGYYKDTLCIVDWKSSLREKRLDMIEDYFLQATMYAMMLLERVDISAKHIIIVIVSPDGFPQMFIRETRLFIPEALGRVKMYYQK